MDEQLFENLLHRGEGEALDFKVDNYAFGTVATEEEESEVLKDILAFANAWRDSDAYILIGVEEVLGSKSVVRGITKRLLDQELQQFVNSKTQRPIRFSYEEFLFDGLPCAAIRIPRQERPSFAVRTFGKAKAKEVYVRRGSTTAIASPDEIAKMGKASVPALPSPSLEVSARVTVEPAGQPGNWYLHAWLCNIGAGTADDIGISFEHASEGLSRSKSEGWEEAESGRKQLAKRSLHPKDKLHIARWFLGGCAFTEVDPEPRRSEYGGRDAEVKLKVFSRHQIPTPFHIRFSKAEIQGQAARFFRPTQDG